MTTPTTNFEAECRLWVTPENAFAPPPPSSGYDEFGVSSLPDCALVRIAYADSAAPIFFGLTARDARQAADALLEAAAVIDGGPHD